MKNKHLKIVKEQMEGLAATHADLAGEHSAMAKAHDGNEALVTGHSNASSLHKVASGHYAKLATACEKMMTGEEQDEEPNVAEMTETNANSFGSRQFAAASRVADLETKIADLQERFGLTKLRPIDGVSAVAPSNESLERTNGSKNRLVPRAGQEDVLDKDAAAATIAKAFPALA